MGFAARFALRYSKAPGKQPLNNPALSKFFDQAAEHFKKLEVDPSKKIVSDFRSQSACAIRREEEQAFFHRNGCSSSFKL